MTSPNLSRFPWVLRALCGGAIVVAAVGCTDEDLSPAVAVREATPEQLSPADDRLDDLTITVGYDDADGDLGGGIAEVHDCRDPGLITLLPIPEIAPEGLVADDARITGSLALHVNDVGLVATATLPTTCAQLGAPASTPEATVFCVVLVDRAGHRGPGDCTGTITLLP